MNIAVTFVLKSSIILNFSFCVVLGVQTLRWDRACCLRLLWTQFRQAGGHRWCYWPKQGEWCGEAWIVQPNFDLLVFTFLLCSPGSCWWPLHWSQEASHAIQVHAAHRLCHQSAPQVGFKHDQIPTFKSEQNFIMSLNLIIWWKHKASVLCLACIGIWSCPQKCMFYCSDALMNVLLICSTSSKHCFRRHHLNNLYYPRIFFIKSIAPYKENQYYFRYKNILLL